MIGFMYINWKKRAIRNTNGSLKINLIYNINIKQNYKFITYTIAGAKGLHQSGPSNNAASATDG